MIKLIASDIDGTLVKDGTLAIDPEYMDVIGRLIDKGIVFVACSGRQYRSERKLFAPIADRLLYITDGGTVVRTPKEILKVDTMPDEIWKGMLSMVHESLPSCDYYIATPDRGFAEDGGSRMFHWLRDSYGYDIQEISDARILDDQQIIKFSVYIQMRVKNCVLLYLLLHGRIKSLWFLPVRNGWMPLSKGPARGRLWLFCRNIWELHLMRPVLSEIILMILKCSEKQVLAMQFPTPARKFRLLLKILVRLTGKMGFCRF